MHMVFRIHKSGTFIFRWPVFQWLFNTGWEPTDASPLNDVYDMTKLGDWVINQMAYFAARPNAITILEGLGEQHSLGLMYEYGTEEATHYAEVAAGVRTLIHGDYRVGNNFFGIVQFCRDDPVAIGWQASGMGEVLYNLVCSLACSVKVELRRAIELECVREYHATPRRFGVWNLSIVDCWRHYRLSMLANPDSLGRRERVPRLHQ